LFEKIKLFAADSHFGVREVAWMACRAHIAAHLEVSIEILSTWAKSEDENLRRFASEATRPRGVWCAHLQALKEQPALALPILEVLHADPSRYVQNSVGNWLNDAAKSQADFVRELCATWQAQSPTKETSYIIKKALRSIS
jgi:3-methyladenine DNA glycosylase AlkC